MALIYNVAFNSQTRVLSLSDRAGNVISSCEVPPRVNPEPLTFTAKENSSVIKLVKHGELENAYEVDTGTGWRSYTLGSSITRNNGQTVKFRCASHPTTQSEDNYVQFEMSGLFEASGNCDSMLTSDFVHLKSLVGYDYAFYKLFYDCKVMTTSPEFPAKTLAPYCYAWALVGTDLITVAPELPATTLAPYCYYGMFWWAIGIREAPELPATTLAVGCYRSMFDNARALERAPELPVVVLVDECYRGMFYDALALTEARVAASVTASYAINNMFSGAGSNGFDLFADPNIDFWAQSYQPVRVRRWVYNATDTGATITMYRANAGSGFPAVTVRVGASDYGVCYAVQGWIGFKTLTQMHEVSYTLQQPEDITLYRRGVALSGRGLVPANGIDGFTEDMYVIDYGFFTLDFIHTEGYSRGEQTTITVYNYEEPVTAYSVEANPDDGFTETMYIIDKGATQTRFFYTIEGLNARGYFLTPTPNPNTLTLSAPEPVPETRSLKKSKSVKPKFDPYLIP